MYANKSFLVDVDPEDSNGTPNSKSWSGLVAMTIDQRGFSQGEMCRRTAAAADTDSHDAMRSLIYLLSK